MKFKNLSFILSFVLTLSTFLLLLLGHTVHGQNCTSPPALELVYSGDFENGMGNATSNYTRSNNLNNDRRYQIGTDAKSFKSDFEGKGHGGEGNFMIVNGANNAGVVVWQTQINDIIPGTNYYFSAWIMTLNWTSATSGVAQLQFYINGIPFGPVVLGPDRFAEWIQTYTKWYSDGNTSAIISVVNLNSNANGNDFGLDDISFKASCEGLAGSGPKPLLGNDRNFCTDNILLDLNSGIGDHTNLSFSWNTGETTPALQVNKPGQYILCVDSAGLGCYKTDTITITSSPITAPVVRDTFACQYSQPIDLNTGASDIFWYDQETGGTGTPIAPIIDCSQPAIFNFYVSHKKSDCESERRKVQVQIYPAPNSSMVEKISVCSGKSAFIGQDPFPGYLYSWQPSIDLLNSMDSKTSITIKNTSNSSIEIPYTLLIKEPIHSCTIRDTTFVTVLPLPQLSIDFIPPLCLNSPDIILQTTPAGGTLKGTQLNGNSFSPQIAGNFPIVYSYKTAEGCIDSAIQTITVLPFPLLDFKSLPAVCESTPTLELKANPAGGEFSGLHVSGNNFQPIQPGSFSITYRYQDPNGCRDSISQQIEVLPSPKISFDPIAPICLNEPEVTIKVSPEGGVFIGNYMNGNFFSAQTAGVFPIVYRYQYPNGCTDSALQNIVVNPSPQLEFNEIPDVCEGAAPILLLATPIGGIFIGDMISDNHFTPSQIGNFSITYKLKDENGCVDSLVQDIVVKPSPKVSMKPFPPVCMNSPDIVLEGSPAGGNFKGSLIEGNIFSPKIAGSFSIIYDFTSANGCKDSASQTLVVLPFPLLNFQKIPPICSGTDSIQLNANPFGGLFSGQYVSGDYFLPEIPGKYPILYKYKDNAGCSDSIVQELTVLSAPSVTFENIPTSCIHDEKIELRAYPPGGTFEGDHLTRNIFLPEEAGNFRIAYIYKSPNTCTDTAWQSAMVKPSQELPVNLGGDQKICQGDQIKLEVNAGKDVSWYPGGETGKSFIAKPKTTTNYKVFVKDDLNCAWGADSILIEVMSPPEAILDSHSIEYCFENGPFTINAISGNTFSWMPGGNTSQQLEVNEPGIYYLTASNDGVCIKNDSIIITELCPARIFVPEAFSPNNDGSNDVLKVFGSFFKNFELRIFNRWGEIIFHTNDLELSWDGNFHDEPMPAGVYPWTIIYETSDERRSISNKGSVVLVR